jgi:hypothetical protein
MQRLLPFFLVSTAILFSTPAHACSFGDPPVPYLLSASVSPVTISGDTTEFATVTAQLCNPNNDAYLSFGPSGFSGTQYIAQGGSCSQATCTFPGIGSGQVTLNI